MERDDLIANDSYSLNATHDAEHGRVIRKKIYFVTILLSVITTAEVLMGVFFKHGTAIWPFVKWSFIVMTLVKAAYIVVVFMHLGDERKSLKYMILAPYAIFVLYLIFVGITESNFINEVWQTYGE
ncbi:cytochrome C oxidase subunit IV family protein [Cryomorpha ignava]|uniref:Cytochrome C oxidase subunit IV family protein n=1 Tax=Cryomorpha ignava TaxID=101383 RepID=A0A7K3WWZ4_9FLAO|nr:cytochrome C oxidase subunit IV family protein [Cryomorpha ignava]NEN25155.1 cytochrome C oxidase subunit IV family protein [Cryomorpha ignava]